MSAPKLPAPNNLRPAPSQSLAAWWPRFEADHRRLIQGNAAREASAARDKAMRDLMAADLKRGF